MRRLFLATGTFGVGLLVASVLFVNEAGESFILDWLSSFWGDAGRRRLALWPSVDGLSGNYGPATARWPQSQFISWTSSETTETINGVVPITSCPAGKYRGAGTSIYSRSNGQRIDGCQFCPRGTYGDSSGLTSAVCSGPCPKGRYRDQKGAVNENDCFLCPPGKVRASVTPHHLADKIMSCYSRLLLLFRFVSFSCTGRRRHWFDFERMQWELPVRIL